MMLFFVVVSLGQFRLFVVIEFCEEFKVTEQYCTLNHDNQLCNMIILDLVY